MNQPKETQLDSNITTPQKSIADADARAQALDHSQSFIVTAPAGSGKTGLLTQRILKLLAYCEHPEEVLAITFTRKAAQEMRQRIINALQVAQKHQSANSENITFSNDNERLTFSLAKKVLEKDQQNNWQLLISPNRLRLLTIDGFCQSLVKQLTFDAGMSSLLSPTEQSHLLYRQAVHNFFSAFKADEQTQKDLKNLLTHVDNDMNQLEKFLIELLQKRSQWLPLIFDTRAEVDGHQFLEDNFQIVIQETLLRLQNALGTRLPALVEIGEYAAKNVIENNKDSIVKHLIDFNYSFHGSNSEDRSKIDPTTITQWKALVELLVVGKPHETKWRSQYNVNLGFPASKDKNSIEAIKKTEIAKIRDEIKDVAGILPLLQDVRLLPEHSIPKSQWKLIDSLTRLLPRLVAEFKLYCEQTTECDFTEMSQSALLALGQHDEPSDLALKLDYKINHILVDEFQDTSLPQLQLLEKLTAGWQPNDGKTLFLVGDAMQSCYAFRDANVGIFLNAKENGIGHIPLTPLELTVNFRSDGKVVEWVNEHFAKIFPQYNNINRGSIQYQQADYFSEPTDHASINNIALVDASNKDEAKHITEIVKKHLQQDDSGRIAILVKERKTLPAILNQFREENLIWQSKDVDKLSDRMAIIDLLSLTKALLNFSDRVAWLAILRAPWCGLDMKDLTIVANHPFTGDSKKSSNTLIWQTISEWKTLPVSDSAKLCLQRLNDVLQPAIAQRHRKPLRQWIEGIWLALGGPATICNPIEKTSPTAFFDLLESHAGTSSSIDDWQAFDEAIAALYDRSEVESRIQVMTIHKSKGLEFETVILPNLERPAKKVNDVLLRWQDFIDSQGNVHLLMSPRAQKKQTDSFYAYLGQEEAFRQNYENTRVLYIACTRAIQHLYLIGKVSTDEKKLAKNESNPLSATLDDIKAPRNKTLLSMLWPNIQNDITLLKPSEHFEDFDVDDEESDKTDKKFLPPLQHILRLSTDWKKPHFPEQHLLDAHRQSNVLAALNTNNIATRNTDDIATLNTNNNDNQNSVTHQSIESDSTKNVPSANSLNHRAERYMGTVLHQALHHFIQYGFSDWNDESLEQQKTIWQTQLRQQGLNSAQSQIGVEKIALGIRNTLNDKDGLWVLDNRHEGSESELSIMDPNAGFRESIIDRTFIADGTRWIIDFKSSEPTDDQNRDDFLQQEAIAYRPQLERYAQVMRHIDADENGNTLPIKIALYFPLLTYLHVI